MSKKDNYLKEELYNLIKTDSGIFDFIQLGALDGMWYWDLLDADSEWMSDQFWELFGIDPKTKEHKASAWQDIIFKEDLEVAMENFTKHLENPNHAYDQVVRYRHADGSTVWVRCRGIIIRDEEGVAIRMLGAHTDLTAYKKLQFELEEKNKELLKRQDEILLLNSKLKKQALEDHLTGLYNRHSMDEIIKIEMEKANRNARPFTICMIDLNKFKSINDRYGHLVGDCVLKDFAKRLDHLLRKQDTKARWGGDEFLVILPETNYDDALEVKEKLYNDMASWSVTCKEEQVFYSVAIGMSEFRMGEDLKECIQRSDEDLYGEKLKVK